MRKIGLLQNVIQEYAWGSRTAIPKLLGQPTPVDKPQAELWMGAHPKAPSQVLCGGSWRSLLEVIKENPEEILGEKTASRFANKLPFLFKVLAAAKPLSIQAHPNRDQATRGFDRENDLRIPLEASHRNYKDDNHKPEIICALTPFWALRGFRKINEILELLETIQPPSILEELMLFRSQPNQVGLQTFFKQLITMEVRRKHRIVAEAVSNARKWANDEPVWKWMFLLNREYPGDIGVLSTVLLNLIQLNPGEAMYLPAGELHAYLEGTGIELMANSDNVLRGGLTPKHIDVQELLTVLSFAESDIHILRPESLDSGETIYQTETAEFELSVITVEEKTPFESPRNRSVEIMICTEGEARVEDSVNGETIRLEKGVSFIVPAAVNQYQIEGNATLYKASVPV
jgi:mannose-6-phosphate isomerase